MQVTATRQTVSWPRKLFHAISLSVVAVVTILTGLVGGEAPLVAAIGAALWVGLDLIRLSVPKINARVTRSFPSLFRRYEKRGLSSASWFAIGAIFAFLVASPKLVALSFLYLGFGDPVASWVGVRYGKIKLPGGKSLEGSLAFFLVCVLVGVTFFVGVDHAALPEAVFVASGGALAGAVAEWAPLPVDDNCRVPVATSSALAILASLLAPVTAA
jgi:dolichol kinase